MAPKSNVPIRIGGSKVRSGCKTCKRRHLKCDERRPVCVRCEKLKLSCAYEAVPPRRSPTPESSVSCYGTWSVEEVSAIKSFVVDLGPELAGCFSNYLFCNVLPRVAQREPVIANAMVALSTLNTSMRLHQSAGPAIIQYNKAIQALNVRLGSTGESQRQREDVILLCCLLFTFFECLQNSVVNALHHIVGGMKLLMEWGSDERDGSPDGYVDRTILQPIYMSLDSQAVQLGAVEFREYSGLRAIGPLRPSQSISFETIEDAHVMLSHIFNRISRWAYWMEPLTTTGTDPGPGAYWLSMEEQRLRVQLAAWDAAFAPLVPSSDSALLLLCNRRTLQVFFDRSCDGLEETHWDKYNPQFREAVQYAEAYMQSSLKAAAADKSHGSSQDRPVFTAAVDIVLPLFLCSARCRDPSTRRRALAMLRVCRRKEGIWDSSACASVCETVIELEERGALPDGTIPEHARIFSMDISLSEDKGASITYKRRLENGEIEAIQADVDS